MGFQNGAYISDLLVRHRQAHRHRWSILLGVIVLITGWTALSHGATISNLWNHGGFFPKGAKGVFLAVQLARRHRTDRHDRRRGRRPGEDDAQGRQQRHLAHPGLLHRCPPYPARGGGRRGLPWPGNPGCRWRRRPGRVQADESLFKLTDPYLVDEILTVGVRRSRGRLRSPGRSGPGRDRSGRARTAAATGVPSWLVPSRVAGEPGEGTTACADGSSWQHWARQRPARRAVGLALRFPGAHQEARRPGNCWLAGSGTQCRASRRPRRAYLQVLCAGAGRCSGRLP